MTSTPNITPAQEAAIDRALNNLFDNLIERYGDLETGFAVLAAYNAAQVKA
jgi:hypothetical protein